MTRYRRAQKADAPKLALLRWALRTDDSPNFDPEAKEQFIRDFVSWMDSTADEDLVHWIAEQDSELIGVISVRVITKMPSPEALDDKFGYVTNTYVMQEHRDKGIGTALLEEVRSWALQKHLELLVVWPSCRAYPFYERGGYARFSDPVVLKLRS